MAHLFFMSIPPPSFHTIAEITRRNSAPLPQHSQSQAEMTASEFILSSSEKRSGSVSSQSSNENTSRSNSSTTCPAYVPALPSSACSRNNSSIAAHRNPSVFNSANIRTRSLIYGAGVVIERLAPPNDDDVIIVTVRLSNKFRKSSVHGCDELPSR